MVDSQRCSSGRSPSCSLTTMSYVESRAGLVFADCILEHFYEERSSLSMVVSSMFKSTNLRFSTRRSSADFSHSMR